MSVIHSFDLAQHIIDRMEQDGYRELRQYCIAIPYMIARHGREESVSMFLGMAHQIAQHNQDYALTSFCERYSADNEQESEDSGVVVLAAITQLHSTATWEDLESVAGIARTIMENKDVPVSNFVSNYVQKPEPKSELTVIRLDERHRLTINPSKVNPLLN